MTSQLLTLQQLINKHTLVYRRHFIPGTDSREDDSSHALSVAIICWHYLEKLKPQNLSAEKVFKYALIHDLVEVYAGDVITYASKKALQQKELDEQKALERLKHELSFEPDLVKHLVDYQAHTDTEAWFVWACDKMQAYTQGQADDWRPHLEIGVTAEVFVNKIAEQVAKTPSCLQPEFERLAQVWTKSFLEHLPATTSPTVS